MTETNYFFTKTNIEHNDVIILGISPSDLERYKQLMVNKAETCSNYDKQKEYHRIADMLIEHLDRYHKARREYDAKTVTSPPHGVESYEPLNANTEYPWER